MKVFYAFDGKKYNEANPPYYYLEGTGWYDKLKLQLPEIRTEVLSFLKSEGLNITSYFHTTRVSGKSWDVIPFMIWGQRNEHTIKQGKNVFGFFADIPGLASAAVSILQPQTSIKGHRGDTDATYRVHIPIYVPTQLPECGLKVSNVSRAWEQDDILVFNDACYHEAWNKTDEPRVVIILDVVKTEYLPQTQEIANHIMSVTLYEHYFLNSRIARLFPSFLRNLIRKVAFENRLEQQTKHMFRKLFKSES